MEKAPFSKGDRVTYIGPMTDISLDFRGKQYTVVSCYNYGGGWGITTEEFQDGADAIMFVLSKNHNFTTLYDKLSSL